MAYPYNLARTGEMWRMCCHLTSMLLLDVLDEVDVSMVRFGTTEIMDEHRL
jgi:hypothetical protein